MFSKMGQALLLKELKIKNGIHRFIHEDKGGTEIVAILLIIIILIAVVIIFREKLSELIDHLFKNITNDVDTKLQ